MTKILKAKGTFKQKEKKRGGGGEIFHLVFGVCYLYWGSISFSFLTGKAPLKEKHSLSIIFSYQI